MIPNIQQTTRALVNVQVNEILKDGEMHWAPSGHWPVPWKTEHRQRKVKQDPWNCPDQQNMPKLRKKLHRGVRRRNKSSFSISPQISGRVESLRLNASASVSIWYVDPIKVAFSCHHIATCFAFKLCAWHVVSQHKGCNKIGNRRPNLCTWLEEGSRQNPRWFEVSVLGIDLRTSQYSHNRHKCWHTALNVSDVIRCVSNTSEMQTRWHFDKLRRKLLEQNTTKETEHRCSWQTRSFKQSQAKKHQFQRLDRWCQSQRREHQSDSEGWNTSTRHQSTAGIETSETLETSKQFQKLDTITKKMKPHSIPLTFYKNRLCALCYAIVLSWLFGKTPRFPRSRVGPKLDVGQPSPRCCHDSSGCTFRTPGMD